MFPLPYFSKGNREQGTENREQGIGKKFSVPYSYEKRCNTNLPIWPSPHIPHTPRAPAPYSRLLIPDSGGQLVGSG
ncbi:MAG: hypothetical protein F6K65_08590 [Moorea sp. SIO3C2]|nr:hypothetical protein [Moorena sp. SIO3C2]